MSGETTTEASGVAGRGAQLRLLQITDTHLFADTRARLAGVDTELSTGAVLDHLRRVEAPADVLLHTGDLVHDGSENAYRRLKGRLEELGVRGLVMPGNHDAPAMMRRLFARGRVTWARNAVLGDWQLVTLSTYTGDGAGGHLADAELGALDRCLAAEPKRHALVCLHHHPVAMGCDWIDAIGVDNGEALFRVLDRHPQVRGVLWGHVHQELDTERNGVRLMATPSTGLQFRPGSRAFAVDDRPPGYRWLHLDADGGIDTGVVRLAAAAHSVDLECGGYR